MREQSVSLAQPQQGSTGRYFKPHDVTPVTLHADASHSSAGFWLF